jgi:hypothetical protein
VDEEKKSVEPYKTVGADEKTESERASSTKENHLT